MNHLHFLAACAVMFTLLLSEGLAADSEAAKDRRSPAVSQSDWPQWRGPNRDGVSTETGMLDVWDEDGPPLLWQTEGLGKGYSSVAVVGGKIFTMGKLRQGAFLIALSVDRGKKLWETRVGSGDPNSTPTVEGNLVYALDRNGKLLCARTTGEEVWAKDFRKDFGGQMMSGWGYSESPLVDGDRLICTPGGRNAILVALDRKTGETVWEAAVRDDIGRRGKDGAAYSSIVISEAGGVRQYVQLVGRGIISVAASDGKVLWTYNRIANGTANIPTPVVKGNYVFCSTGYGAGAALLEVKREGDGLKAEEVYFLKSNELQNHHGGMVLVGDHVYCGHGHGQGFPLSIELKSGKVAWRPGRGPGKGSAAVLYADGHLYFRYENAVMALIEAKPDSYSLKGSFRIASRRGKSWPHPVIAGGRLYLRDQEALLCYKLR